MYRIDLAQEAVAMLVISQWVWVSSGPSDFVGVRGSPAQDIGTRHLPIEVRVDVGLCLVIIFVFFSSTVL